MDKIDTCNSHVKQFDDSLERIRHHAELGKKRLAIHGGKTNFAENYSRVEMYLGLRCVSGVFEQYGFVFQRINLSQSDVSSDYAKTAYIRDSLYKTFVLADNVELMDGPEKFVSSVVRVERFDGLNCGGAQPLFAFDPILGVDKVILGTENWKVRTFGRLYTVPYRKRRSDKVKGSSIGVDDKTEFSVDRMAYRFHNEYAAFIRGIRIRVFPHYLEVVHPLSNAPLEGWEVGFAPVD